MRDWVSVEIAFSFILVGFFFTLALTGWVKNILQNRALLDIPNSRSSHKTPVPRGGGWALVIVLLPALIGAAVWFDSDARHAGLIGAVALLAAISWLDDRGHVSARVRLSMHILAACLGSYSFAPHELLLHGLAPFWLDRALMILGWAWFINLYNFMDGIDGITGSETISIAVGACLVMTAAGINDPFAGFLILILIGACLGFLAHNWHPAKIFLGDVGSVPLGYLTGFCLLSVAVKGHFAAALILPLYYLADSGITLVRRALRGEKIWQAHREHFYQKAALAAGRHDRIVWEIVVADMGLIGAAVLSVSHPWAGLGAGIVIVAVLLGKLHKTAAR
ncbi:MAG: glycosyltransferase family 4 protein [Alphaproteobacteria bacterium]|nr:glycosyltransferase family 4 protein [Alphaproteobacteria bacterium]